MTSSDLWYFAYGSNLDPPQKTARTGAIREGRPSELVGYSFVFNKRSHKHGAAANIIPHPACSVWGVAFRMKPKWLNEMDRHEVGYSRATVEVRDASGASLQAITYIADSRNCVENVRPTIEYRDTVLRGAAHWRLPEDYIKAIRIAGGLIS